MGVIAQCCKTDTPSDVWREGCWQFMSFEASINERLATAVFGVSLPPGRSICRALLRQGLVGEAVVTASGERIQWPLVEHVPRCEVLFGGVRHARLKRLHDDGPLHRGPALVELYETTPLTKYCLVDSSSGL